MSVTQEIKNRLDILDVISEHVQLRRSGRNYAGFCPFHSNSRTPAFYVFPETQTWRCFGACAEGGDVFGFVMKKNGWEFKEALVELARLAGVELEKKTADRGRQTAEDKLVELMAAAAEYFHQLLLHAPQAEETRHYVESRQLNGQTIADFQLGYALDGWDNCHTHFNAQGYSDDDLLQAGLLTENPEKGRRYDRFRNRLMIPIRDAGGRVVGFGARTLDKDGVPKYLNSPQTPLFDKSRLLYGLDLARRHIREARQAVIVEGYLDVMQAWQAGYRNVVAQMGTALTEDQLRQLQRYAKQFILALDADRAGAKATLRSLEVARETLDREVDVRFNARGLLQYEGRLKADIRVITLPEGQDPDSLIRANPQQWPLLLAEAKPVVAYVLNVVSQELDLTDGKAKSAAAQQVLPLIGDIADPVERDHYRHLLAEILQIDELALRQAQGRLLRQAQGQMARKSRRTPERPTEREAPPSEASAAANGEIKTNKASTSKSKAADHGMREGDFLRQCLQYPHVLVTVNQMLRRYGQPEVSANDFEVAEDGAILGELYRRLATSSSMSSTSLTLSVSAVVTIEELCDDLDLSLSDRVRMLLALPAVPEAKLDRLPDTLVSSVLSWRLERLKEHNRLFGQLLREERDRDAAFTALYGEQIKLSHQLILSINKVRASLSPVARRRTMRGRI
jgi:DNA primase